MAFTTGTLTGTYLLFDGTPAAGTIEIIPNSQTLIDAEGNEILSGRVKVQLDPAGSFSVVLPSTDDPTVEPAVGRQYTVSAKLRHAHLAAATFELPGGSTLDMADVSDSVATAAAISVWLSQAAYLADQGAQDSALLTEATTRGNTDTALDGRLDTLEAVDPVRSVVAGTNVTVDATDPRNPVVSAAGGGGSGVVEAVAPGTGIDVDSAVPTDPVVALDAPSIAALLLAATATQPGDLGTAATAASTDFATFAQGATADTAVQPGTLATVAASGDAGDLTGTLPSAALPPLAITEAHVVASQAAMLALSAERGDVAIRTDVGKSFILSTDSPTTLADWVEITAAGAVTSVAGRTGTVSLAKADVGLTNVADKSPAQLAADPALAAAFVAADWRTAAALAAANPVVPLRGVAHAYDTGVLALGDGATAYANLPKFRPSATPQILRSTASQTGIVGTITDLTGLAGLQFTVGAQPWVVELWCPWLTSSAAHNTVMLYIATAAGVTLQQSPAFTGSVSVGQGRVQAIIDTPGAYNVKGQIQRASNVGTVGNGASLAILEATMTARPFVP